MVKVSKKTHMLIDEINSVADQINEMLNSKQKERYFEGIAIIYSLIENVLKWLVFTQVLWNKAGKPNGVMPDGEVDKIREFCNQQNFHSLLNIALMVDLIAFKKYKKLNDIRIERNSLVHEYWLYVHKGKLQIFRKKLEKLAGAMNDLVGTLNFLIEEIGPALDESFLEVAPGRNFILR